jgi:hypothetical protein
VNNVHQPKIYTTKVGRGVLHYFPALPLSMLWGGVAQQSAAAAARRSACDGLPMVERTDKMRG